MKKSVSRVLALLLCVSMLAEFAPASLAAKGGSEELLPSVLLSDAILDADDFYIANDSVSLDENADINISVHRGKGRRRLRYRGDHRAVPRLHRGIRQKLHCLRARRK